MIKFVIFRPTLGSRDYYKTMTGHSFEQQIVWTGDICHARSYDTIKQAKKQRNHLVKCSGITDISIGRARFLVPIWDGEQT
jgi:hypothetical protein